MAIVVQLIKQAAPWIYGLIALTAMWYLRIAFLSRRARRFAVFSMEREFALNRTYGAWTVALILVVAMGLVYFTSTVVSDAVAPLVQVDVTPTALPTQRVAQAQPTPTLPLPQTLTPTAAPAVTPTATAKPKPSVTPTASAPSPTPAPAVRAPGCPDGRSIITAPGVGQTVSGMVPIFGTAVHDQFKFYKLELAPGASPADSQWSYFAGGERPVQGGALGTLNSGALRPGTYSIRLVVVDVTGNYPRPCQTTVVVN